MLAPGGDIKMDEANHRTWKPVLIGKILGDGQFKIVNRSKGLVKPEPWSEYTNPDKGCDRVHTRERTRRSKTRDTGVSPPAVTGLAVKLAAKSGDALREAQDHVWEVMRRRLWNRGASAAEEVRERLATKYSIPSIQNPRASTPPVHTKSDSRVSGS